MACTAASRRLLLSSLDLGDEDGQLPLDLPQGRLSGGQGGGGGGLVAPQFDDGPGGLSAGEGNLLRLAGLAGQDGPVGGHGPPLAAGDDLGVRHRHAGIGARPAGTLVVSGAPPAT